MGTNIIWFKELGKDDVESVGGKNSSLGEMISNLTQLGVKVPDGYATTAEAFRRFIAFNNLENHINDELNNLDVEDVNALQKCGAKIRQWVIDAPLQDDLQKEYSSKLAGQKMEYENKVNALQKEKKLLNIEKQKIHDSIENGVKEKIKEEKSKIEKQLRITFREEQEEQFNALQKELQEKSEKLKAFNKAKADIERLKREKEELRDEIEAETQKKLNEELKKEELKIRKTEEEKSELKLSEQSKIIEQLNKQLKEAQRKAEQGSMQLQGEVQELAIEEYLNENFPLDNISEIKKGARGADCLQIVNTRSKPNCGSIYYESKRTKDFQKSWIEKFKSDLREKNADIGVLVTEAMPSDMERVGQVNGIWVCTYNEFKGLCFVLRESLIQISQAISSQENKGDKMTMLYDFLTGNEFRMQIEAIVEGFSQMHDDLEREKRAMQGLWKKREKQIEKVLLNTNNMYNSVKGIAGKAIQPVKALELPEPE